MAPPRKRLKLENGGAFEEKQLALSTSIAKGATGEQTAEMQVVAATNLLVKQIKHLAELRLTEFNLAISHPSQPKYA
jgi:hypothetical protein